MGWREQRKLTSIIHHIAIITPGENKRSWQMNIYIQPPWKWFSPFKSIRILIIVKPVTQVQSSWEDVGRKTWCILELSRWGRFYSVSLSKSWLWRLDFVLQNDSLINERAKTKTKSSWLTQQCTYLWVRMNTITTAVSSWCFSTLRKKGGKKGQKTDAEKVVGRQP